MENTHKIDLKGSSMLLTENGFHYHGYEDLLKGITKGLHAIDKFHYVTHIAIMKVIKVAEIALGNKVKQLSIKVEGFNFKYDSDLLQALKEKLTEKLNISGFEVVGGWVYMGCFSLATIVFSPDNHDTEIKVNNYIAKTNSNNTSTFNKYSVNDPNVISVIMPKESYSVTIATNASLITSTHKVNLTKIIEIVKPVKSIKIANNIKISNVHKCGFVKVKGRLIREDKVQLRSSESFYPIPYDDGTQKSLGFGSEANNKFCDSIWKRANMSNGKEVAKLLHTAGYKKSLKILDKFKNRKGVLTLVEAENLQDKEWQSFKNRVDQDYTFLPEKQRRVLGNVTYNTGYALLAGYKNRIPESQLSILLKTKDWRDPNNRKAFEIAFRKLKTYNKGLMARRMREYNAFFAEVDIKCAIAHCKDLIDDTQNYTKFS